MIKNKKNLLCLLCLLIPIFIQAQAIKVEINQTENGWQLLRDGKPYYVKGVGGKTHLNVVVEIGGNSIRTWGTEEALETLDEAHKHGLTVMMGLWVQHERHGFDYNNKAAVKKQFDYFKSIVTKLKDHPALLLWGVGNEVDLVYTNTNVWYAVNDIAKMIHEIDPNHPTTTVTAGFDPEEVKLIKERAPEIDIYSINTYGDIANLDADIKKAGWHKPYMVTEWGPDGHWEVATTSWGAPLEQNSTVKAEAYYTRYSQYIAPNKAQCVGSYVFLWGQKQETTETWYGIFSVDGLKSETVDKLALAWTGSYPENRAPKLDSLVIEEWKKGDDIILKGGRKYQAKVYASDPDNDPLTIKWRIEQESTSEAIGGDYEDASLVVSGAIKSTHQNEVIFKSPVVEGPYRLYVFIYDQKGHYAYDNIPLYSLTPSANEKVEGVQFKQYSLDSFNQTINRSILLDDNE